MREDVSPAETDLEPRNRIERARVRALTPRERLAAMQRLIDEGWALLQANPDGLAQFRRRNFRARSVGRRSGP
jgi:hypothetical protein